MMTQNEKKITLLEEARLNEVFSKVRDFTLEPSPYLKTRVLANLLENQTQKKSQKKSLRIWKTLFASALTLVVVLSWYSLQLSSRLSQDGVANEAYVIHVDFSQNDLLQVTQSEVVLPEGVHFVSTQGKTQPQRHMILPVQITSSGPGRLPFVVSANTHGEKKIVVRLLDKSRQLVREQVLKLKFAKSDNETSL